MILLPPPKTRHPPDLGQEVPWGIIAKFFDSREISENEVIKTEICIIGAGVAGLSLAREMISRSFRVVLLESGGLEFDDRTQVLNHGFNIGRDYFSLDTTRARYFGGTSNHFGGECTLLDPFDLEERPWLPHSGWPLRRSDFDPYYERAHEFCAIGPVEYDGDYWLRELGPPVLGPLFERLVQKAAQFSVKRYFGEEYRDELRNAANVGVYLYGNATELETNDTGNTVRRVRVATLGGCALLDLGQVFRACRRRHPKRPASSAFERDVEGGIRQPAWAGRSTLHGTPCAVDGPLPVLSKGRSQSVL